MPEYVNIGDALRGEKIAVEASEIDIHTVAKRSSRHRGQFGTLRNNAFCVIEQPMRWVLEKNESKRTKRK